MFKPVSWNALSRAQQDSLLKRPVQRQEHDFTCRVQRVINEVRKTGDKAIRSFTKQFDKVDIENLKVREAEFDAAMRQVPSSAIEAFAHVVKHLTAFHRQQRLPDYAIETSPGILCEQAARPIQRVGLYVPAGSAPLVSTVLMLGVPSQLAGCPLRILCSPPDNAGNIDPNILVAARLSGIDTIFKVGGAQAIAAMAYGTESVPKVDKIFGPGNRWVTTAKMLVSLDPNGALLDMPAGPSEVLVVADDRANPSVVAADLLSQAEHGEDSQVLLICISQDFAQKVLREIDNQLKSLSRAAVARQSLQNSILIVVDGVVEAIAIANQYAPEHLILQIADPREYLPEIHSAGSVFLGDWTPESAGDYASGTNHVLPTYGFARSCSGLSVRDFIKTVTVQELTRDGLVSIAETIRILTGIEGLDAHQHAIDIRLQSTGVHDG
ncbi:histidinol dehydrogenase [Legionella londiniensis]|uniref:Histidinol dehydrogenase n=1 Tax=Legionella londiniensis TaxID=45068 RepID=A0A0W0VR44_9GAMM|nr:histidinol dehydrogenase [Legionella londiniensis]KTD22563.1 histidinol dehydrogenase [Legionella londiniensis]STX92494.1 histidinol dehydrogenase [Legionella londiniensis]